MSMFGFLYLLSDTQTKFEEWTGRVKDVAEFLGSVMAKQLKSHYLASEYEVRTQSLPALYPEALYDPLGSVHPCNSQKP